MIKKLLYLLSINAIILSCHTSYDREEHEIVINIDNAGSIMLSDIVDNVDFIVLETNLDFLVGSISKLIIDQNNLYILDVKSQKVLCFDNEGKPVFIVDDYGKGPEEYVRLLDIDINQNTKTLELLDRSSSRILQYDLAGNYKSSKRLPIETLFFAIQERGGYLLYNQGISRGIGQEYKYSLFSLEFEDTCVQGLIPYYGNCDRLATPTCLYNKTSRKLTVYKEVLDDINGLSFGHVTGLWNGCLVVVHEALDLLESESSALQKNKDLSNLKETDNPVIGLYHLK